jgi:hypothetical protein
VYCTNSIGKIPSLGEVFLTFLLLISRWVIGSGAAIGALDEGLLYMKEVRNGEERRGKERREERIEEYVSIGRIKCITW